MVRGGVILCALALFTTLSLATGVKVKRMWYKKIIGGEDSIKWMVFLAIAVAMLVPSISYGYGTITGIVSNQVFGQALSGVTVEALCNNTVVKATTTDINGNYSLASLSPEVYSIRASVSGYTIRFFPSSVRISENTSLSNINISLVPIGQGMIVFDSVVNDNREIYAVNVSSSSMTTAARLTYNFYDNTDPCTSIDGQRIAFVSTRDGNPEVYIMNRDGSSQSRITYNNASDISPFLSPDASRVAFSSNRDGNYEIYLMDTNGSNPTRLTNHSATDSYPAFSPDGRKIAFSSNRGGGYDLYIMNADGSGVTRLTNTADTETTPVFSPDGQKIAFCLQKGTNTAIYSVNVNGTGTATMLTEGSQPVFSPDSRQISFCSARTGRLELYVINTDGTGTSTRLPIQPQFQNNNPSWSPGAVGTGSVTGSIQTPETLPVAGAIVELMQNRAIIATITTTQTGQWTINNLPMGLFHVRVTCAGYKTIYLPQPITIAQNSQTTANILLYPLGPFFGKIAFVSSRDGNQEIYICNADGSKQTRLTYNQVSNIDPYLSPDGKKIVFTSRRSGNEDIFIMDSDGSNQKMLTNTSWNDCYPSFSPDGKKIVFTSYRYGNADIFLIDMDTMEVTRLTNNPWDEQSPAFSPDGDNIAYDAFVNNTHKIYIMSNDGRNQHRLTVATGNEYYPTFSPDGETITFTSNMSMDYEIYTININGTDTRRLTNSPGRDFKSCFAPDGRGLAFYSERQDGYEIYTMNENGSNVERLTFNIDSDFYPSWGVGFVPIGAIAGTITNKLTNTIIAGAIVEIIQGIAIIGSATTNVNGNYSITEIPAGLFTVRVSCPGYIPASFQGQVTVTQGFITPDINVSLRTTSISQTKIAFTSYVTNDNAEIYIVNHDGNRPTRLTYSSGYDGDSVISQDGKKLVFCSNRDGNSEIYIMEDDGSTQLRLTNNGASDREPQFSSDGQKLVFTSNRDGRDEIYTMDTKGNNLQRLTYTTGNSCDPSFSPDGTRIVFSSTRDGNYEIYIMSLDGLNLRRLTTNSAEDRDPVFSPDNTKIVFWSSRDGNREIYTMNIDGSNQRRLTYNTGCDDDPFFSPDGSKIAFCSTYNNKIEIYTMDPDGTHQERVTFFLDNIYTPIWGVGNVGTGSISGRIFDHLDNPVSGVLIEVLGENMNEIGSITTNNNGNYTVDNLPIGYFMLRASLDGYETRFYSDKLHITTGIRILSIDIPLFPIGSSDGKIVFTANRDRNAEIYIMNADGTSQSRLTNSLSDEQNPSFSHDGTRVLFASNRDGNYEIYLMNADGTEQKRLTDNSAKDSCPVFSPDDKLIAFHSDRSKTFEIYTMNADGSNQIRLGTGIAPCFSPDSSRIVFARYYSNNYDIFIMNRDGSDQKRLTTNTAYDYDPVFSPDGEQIAFTSHRDGNAEVYIMNIDGSNQMRLTNSSNYDGESSFLPDGKLIAFVSGRLGNNDEIWIMDINGNNVRRVTNNSSNDYQPSWTVASVGIISSSISGTITSQGAAIQNALMELVRDNTVVKSGLTNAKGMYTITVPGTQTYSLRCSAEGYAFRYLDTTINLAPGTKKTGVNMSLLPLGAKGGKIAFVSDYKGNPDIYICNADGSNPTRLTNSPAVEGNPCLSYDGGRIVFHANIEGTNELYIMNIDDSGLRRLTTNSLNDEDPHLSPDGKTIVYASGYNQNKEIYTLDVNTLLQKRLTYNFYNDSFPRFSPDGSRIVFCSERDGLPQVYMMNADGSNQVNLTGLSSANRLPSFSMDGSKVLFCRGTNELCEITLLDGSIRTLSAGSGSSCYSPDNKSVVYSLGGNIHTIGSLSLSLTTNSANNHSPSWSVGEVKCGGIYGLITNAVDAQPVSGAMVSVCQGTNTIASAITGTNGRYSFSNLVAEKYSLKVACPGYAIKYFTEDVSIIQDTTVEIKLSLQPIGSRRGKIAFVSDRDGNKEIYIMNGDGSNQTRLTDNYVDDYDPSLSPDGARVVFCSMRDNNEEIYIMNAFGTGTLRLTNSSSSDRQPRFSPDGTKIAWTSNRDGDDDIYIMDADGKNQKKLTNSMANEYSPCFSPDNKRIAFCSDYQEGISQVYFMNMDGQGWTQTTNIPGGSFNPCFSPDGLRLIVWAATATDTIYTMNIGETGAQVLRSGSGTLSYSPDGEGIAFVLNDNICVMNANGSFPIIGYGHNYSPSWSVGEVKTGGICGNITCSLNSTPICGAMVEVWKGTTTISRAVTDVNGAFLIQGLVAEPYFIRAWADDYNTQCIQGTISIIAGTDTPNIFLSLTPVVKGGLVAFSSNDGIYLMNADGTVTTRLTPPINYIGTGSPPGYYAPNLSPDGRMIVFSSNVGGNMDIYMMDTSGQNMVKLTNTTAVDDFPCFSPDGRFIAFVSGGDIRLMNIKAGSITTLLKAAQTTTAINFSPDGTRLIFCSSKDGLPQVYSMDIRGTITRNLTGSSSTNLSPSFSPDGKFIVFSSDRDGGRHRLYLMEPDGSNQFPIPINLDSELQDPCFSPDGTRVIFWANNPDLYTVRLDGSDLKQLTSGTASDTEPSWSAGAVGSGRIIGTIINKMDGYAVPGAIVNLYSSKQVMKTAVTDVFGDYIIPDVYIGEYMLTISYPGRYALNRIPALVRVISDLPTIINASISPTGKKNGRICFVSQAKDGTDTEIYIMNADGSNRQQLTSNLSNEKQPCLSSDGEKIAFVSDAEGNDDIWLMNSNATNKVRLTTGNTQDNNPRFSSCDKKIVYDCDGGIKIIDLVTMQQTIIPGSASSPSFSSDGQRIVFTHSLNEKDTSIYICNADGTNPISLTGSSSQNHSPTFSPDGLKIAFVSDRDGNENIYIMDNDGANQGRLTNNTAQNLSPSFSPDGQYINFYSNQDGNNEIYACDIEGRTTQRLTQNLIDDSQPSWGIGDVINLSGGVSGLVGRYLNSIPIYGAKIAVYQGATLLATTTTSINGTYSLSGIPVGISSIVASHPEYITMVYEQEVQVTANNITTNIDFRLPFIQKQGRIAFVSNRDGNHEIYTMNGDVSNQQRLTFNITDDTQPSMSMDGAKIAFVSNRDGNPEIYIMDEEGQGQKRLTISGGEDSHPCVSADGSNIVFCSERDGNFEIYFMNINGTNQMRLTKNMWDDKDPFFSLDGRKIVFTRMIDNNKEIYIMNADGSSQTRLTNNSPTNDYDTCLSPDGKKIAYTCVGNNNEEIFIMNVDGSSGVKQLTNHPANDYDPQFSPDGNRIAFCSDRDGFKRIYVMDLNGEGLYPLINLEPNDHLSPIMNLDSMEPSWVPGGYGQASIAGTVTSACSMETVFGARIEAVQGIMVAGAASSGPTGKYTIFGLTPGTYRLRISATGYATGWIKESIVIKKDQATSVVDFGIIPIGSKGGKITFVSQRTGSCEIFVMNGDGTNQTRLTYGGFNNYAPEFSYDGREIVFVSDRTGNNEIYIMEADGTGQKRLTYSTRDNQSPSFSFNDGQIIFSSNDEFMVMNIDGTGQRRLESNLTGKSPAFSPDGTRIVFVRDNKIFLVPVQDGGNSASLTDGSLQESEPVFSPDGETIAFTGTDTTVNNQEGFVFNLFSRTITRLTQSFRSDAVSSYSPDGKRIAFTSDRDGSNEIYSMTLDGSGQMRLTNNNANDCQPSWAPGNVGSGNISGKVSSAFGVVAVKKAPDVSHGDAKDTKGTPVMEVTAVSADTATDAISTKDLLAMLQDDGKADTTATSATDRIALQPSSDTPISKALVEVLQDGVVIASTLTDANGQYTFAGLAGGNYLLRCSAPPEYGVKVLTKEATIAIEGKTITLNMELFPIGASGGRIVFVSGEYGNPEICSIYPDSSGLARLTNNPANDRDPSLSPDGSRVVFVSDREGNDELYLMNIDGTCQMQLTNTPINEYTPVFSSDGKKIAYCLGTNIFLMNSDGSGVTQLTENLSSVSSLNFSSDGITIAFASNGHIYSLNTSLIITPLRLTGDNTGFNTTPCFSPNGTKLAFASDRDGNSDIYLMNTDGTNQIMVTNDLNKNVSPTFSPDGNMLVFCSQMDTGKSSIAMIGMDGKNRRIVMDSLNNDYSPCWGVEYQGLPTIHGSLSVTTIPSGARVSLNGVDTNKFTPCVLSVLPGTHTIALTRDWYQSWKGTAIISQEQAVSMSVVLSGFISLASTPSGAMVYLDGTSTNRTTPCVLSNVPAGTHIIGLSKDGYQLATSTITITGTNTFLDLPLIPLVPPATTSSLAVVKMESTISGNNISTNISVTGTDKLIGAHLIFRYDIGNINVGSITPGAALSGLSSLFFPQVNTQTGKVDISLSVLGATIPAGNLLNITSIVTSEGITEPNMVIVLETVDLRDGVGNQIPCTIFITSGTTTPPSTTTSGSTLRLSPSVINVAAGDIFFMDIVAENVTDLTVAETHLLFNPQLLQVIDSDSILDGIQIRGGEFPGGADIIKNTVDNNKGLISFTANLLLGTATGNGTVATIIFKSIRGGTATIAFSRDAVKNQETKLLDNHLAIPINMATATVKASGSGGSLKGVVGMLEANSLFFTDQIIVTLNGIGSVWADKAGYFCFSGIAPGIYTLTADIPGASPATRSEIVVVENGQVDIGTISLLAGDANNDGAVNGYDLLALRGAFGSMKGEINWNPEADFRPDGYINGYDLLSLRHNYGMMSKGLAPFISRSTVPVDGLPVLIDTASLSIEPCSINPVVNNVFTVKVRVANIKDLTVAELHLAFNPEVLEVVDADSSISGVQIGTGDFPAGSGVIKNQTDNQTGVIDFTSYLLSGVSSGAGVLATINFRAKAVGTSGITFEFNTVDNRETKVLSPSGAINIVSNNASLGVSLKPLSDRFINVKAYPNPLIIGTSEKIAIEGLPTIGMVDIKIYNIAGELVRDESVPAPDGKWKWDARNNDNQRVASGIYIYLMTNGKDKAMGKIAVIK